MSDMISLLTEIGLTPKEAKVYLSLLENGPIEGLKLSKLLNEPPPVIYRVLRRLTNKGIVLKTTGRPMKFKALPIDIATSLLVEEKERVFRHATETRRKILHAYERYLRSKDDQNITFIEIEGSTILMKIVQQMILNAKDQILLFINTEGLNRMIKWHKFDYDIATSRGVRIRVLTPKTQDANVLSQISKWGEIKFFNGIFARFVIRDEDEIILLTDSKIGSSYKHFGIYSKDVNFIKTFISIFDFIWKNV